LQAIDDIGRLQTAREEGLGRLIAAQTLEVGGGADDDRAGSRPPATPYAEYRDRLAVTYELLTRRPSRSARASHLWNPSVFASVISMGIGLFAGIFTIAQGPLFPDLYGPDRSTVLAIQYLLSLILLFSGAAIVAWQLISLERFYEYRDRVLRSLYLRSEDPEILMSEADSLQDLLDNYGPRWSRHVPDRGRGSRAGSGREGKSR
jgi:hypothetical protein